MSDTVHITYVIDMEPPDILAQLSEEADILRDGNSGASDDELADLFGEAAEEIARLRKELAAALTAPEDTPSRARA